MLRSAGRPSSAAALPADAEGTAAHARLRLRGAARSARAMRRRVAGAPAALRALDARAATPQIAPLTGSAGRHDDESGPCSATCSAATREARDFVGRSRATTAARGCDSATTRTAGGPSTRTTLRGHLPRGQRRRRKCRRRGSIAHTVHDSPALAIDSSRNPLPAFGGVGRRGHRGRAARCAAGLPHAGARRDRRRLRGGRRAPRATCSVRRRPSAGPEAGTRFRHRRTASAARRSIVRSKRALRRHLERFRMAGYDLEVDAPRFVPLDVALHVCVKPGYFRSRGAAAVRDVLSSTLLRRRPARRLPSRTTSRSAQPVYPSRVIAAAQAVEGVDSVRARPIPAARGSGSGSLENRA